MIFGRTGQVAGLGGVSAKRIAAILALSLVAACAGGAQKKADLEGLTAEDIYKRGEYLLETDKIGPFFFMAMAIVVNMDVRNRQSE